MKKKCKKNILLIGVGGTGSDAVDMIYGKIHELKSNNGNHISAIVFDTDVGSIEQLQFAKSVPLADTASVGTIVDRVGKQYIREWFPVDDSAIRSQEMIRGASQWRKKSYLAFLNLMSKPKQRATFINALEEMTVDPNASCEVYVISSLAGGTGSGSFIPIALYAKRYLRKNLGKNPIVNAMIALPDIFADSQTPENKTKIFANAYAILRELNAINLVARNYNDGHSVEKKAQIKIKIGHKDEPNVGMLFDSLDPAYWTPEAAPFSQIFVLDKIPCVTSVKAHNKVLGDSLYSLICTDIGAEIDSEFSNHEIVRSQANGSNAVYASISTSQIRFPVETLLDYIAHKRTINDCDKEWLTLYKNTDNQVKIKKNECSEMNRRFVMDNKEYADLYLQQLEDDYANNDGRINDIVDRGTAVYDEKGVKMEGTNSASMFVETLERKVVEKIPKADDKLLANINRIIDKHQPKNKKSELNDFIGAVNEVKSELLKYFKACIEGINRTKSTILDAILPLDKSKNLDGNKELSLVANVFKTGDKYIHPVAAMTQLCRLRSEIKEPEKGKAQWEELKKQIVNKVPNSLLRLSGSQSVPKSAFFNEGGEDRMINVQTLVQSSSFKRKFNYKAEMAQLQTDAVKLLANINAQANNQVKDIVYRKVVDLLDIFLEKYKVFFGRFDKEKAALIEETNDLKARDAEVIDSIINVYCSAEDKENVFRMLDKNADYITDEDLALSDDISGRGVFESIYDAVLVETSGNVVNDNDVSGYHSLFDNMIKNNKEIIRKNDVFKQIQEYNVIEAIEAMTGGKDTKKALQHYFQTALDRATPSLKVDMNETTHSDLVCPSNTLVFMISEKTASYIKKNAEKYDLRINFSSNDGEIGIVKACVEQFIKKYSGSESARVCIVNNLPNDSVIYCTGETMDITPLRIEKFDELSPEADSYFSSYSKAIYRMDKYKTDMWNPHLGNNFHKRGYLPYMNEEMEKICDKKLGKAILYTLKHEIVKYEAIGNKKSFVCLENGVKIDLRDENSHIINEKNIAALFSWYRTKEDYIIDYWAKGYDLDFERQLNGLPMVTNLNDVNNFEGCMTRSEFVKSLKEELCKVNNKSYSIIGFAYLVKLNEETVRDNDDAERILRVAYDSFLEMANKKVNKDISPDIFIQIYHQQLANIYESVASFDIVKKAGLNARSTFQSLVSWLDAAKVFKDINLDEPFDEFGNITIEKTYTVESKDPAYAALSKIIEDALKSKKINGDEAGKAVEETAPAADGEAAPVKNKKGAGRPKKINN